MFLGQIAKSDQKTNQPRQASRHLLTAFPGNAMYRIDFATQLPVFCEFSAIVILEERQKARFKRLNRIRNV
jgi:hypothetical protein